MHQAHCPGLVHSYTGPTLCCSSAVCCWIERHLFCSLLGEALSQVEGPPCCSSAAVVDGSLFRPAESPHDVTCRASSSMIPRSCWMLHNRQALREQRTTLSLTLGSQRYSVPLSPPTTSGGHDVLAWLLEEIWRAHWACVDPRPRLEQAGQPPVASACLPPRVATAKVSCSSYLSGRVVYACCRSCRRFRSRHMGLQASPTSPSMASTCFLVPRWGLSALCWHPGLRFCLGCCLVLEHKLKWPVWLQDPDAFATVFECL